MTWSEKWGTRCNHLYHRIHVSLIEGRMGRGRRIVEVRVRKTLQNDVRCPIRGAAALPSSLNAGR